MHDFPMLHDQRQWDSLCCVRGQPRTSHMATAWSTWGRSLLALGCSVAWVRWRLGCSAHCRGAQEPLRPPWGGGGATAGA